MKIKRNQTKLNENQYEIQRKSMETNTKQIENTCKSMKIIRKSRKICKSTKIHEINKKSKTFPMDTFHWHPLLNHLWNKKRLRRTDRDVPRIICMRTSHEVNLEIKNGRQFRKIYPGVFRWLRDQIYPPERHGWTNQKMWGSLLEHVHQDPLLS